MIFCVYPLLLYFSVQPMLIQGNGELVNDTTVNSPYIYSFANHLGVPELVVSPRELTLQVSTTSLFNVSYRDTLLQPVTLTFHLVDQTLSDCLQIDADENCTLLPGDFGYCEISVTALRAHQNILILPNCSSDYCPFQGFRQSFVRVNVVESDALIIVTVVIGWLYFIAWSVSFYPQIYENWKLKSVAGLDFNFIALNITGFVCYSIFNCAFYWSNEIARIYFEKNPFGVIPVQPNDIFFGLHAIFATTVVIVQCFIYEKAVGQRVAYSCVGLLVLFAVFASVSLGLVLGSKINWLLFIQFISYIKLAITLLKYIPQAYYNYKRQSTVGWSIGNILLDLTGGSFSLLQLFLDAYNYNDFHGIFEDFTKFGLGAISLCFDLLFIVQHYVLYRDARKQTGSTRSSSISPISSVQSQSSFPTNEKMSA